MTLEACTPIGSVREALAFEELAWTRRAVSGDALSSTPADTAQHSGVARPGLAAATIAPQPLLRKHHKLMGGWFATASSLAVHAVLVGLLIAYVPWSTLNLADDEISVELLEDVPAEPAAEPQLPLAAPLPSTQTAEAAAPPTGPPDAARSQAAPPAPVPAVSPRRDPADPDTDRASAAASQFVPRSTPALPAARAASPPAPLADAIPTVPSLGQTRQEREAAASERARQRLEQEKRQQQAEAAAHERMRQRTERRRSEQEAAAGAQPSSQAQARERSAPRVEEPKRQAEAPEAAASAAAQALVSPSAYRVQVMGHLQAFKRYPPAARARNAQGNPAVAFSIDASGHVLSVSLTRSSGDPDIDAESVAMVRRASPFPPPPPGGPRAFSAGLSFHLQ